MIKFEFEAIGTFWQIDILDNLPKEKEVVLLEEIRARINDFDKTYSRFRKDSLVTEMSITPGRYTLPEDADLMLKTYKKMYDATGGLVTPLIGKVMVQAGYDPEYSFVENEMVSPLPWEEAMNWLAPTLCIIKPSLLDFGAGGKGYLVDIVSEKLEVHQVSSYCVDAGGDMRQRNATKDSLRVGLENPEDMSEAIGVVPLLNMSLCGSSGNRRKWGRFHHVIDPKKLSSPEGITAVWTLAETTLVADLVATGLYFVSADKLKDYFKFEYLILKDDHSVEKSDGFNAELFLG